MATTRIFIDQPLQTNTSIELPEQAAHHVARVLRMRVHEPLVLFNGQGGEYGGKIHSINRTKVKVEIVYFTDVERESPISIELAQGLSKGEKMDFTIQKAVELGVSSIVPLMTTYSNVKLDEDRAVKKLDHWRKVIISACEQCGRNQIPDLSPISKLTDWQTTSTADLKLILDPQGDDTLSTISVQPQTISIVIGPEGGLSHSEIDSLSNEGFTRIQLGSRILRTETAALATIATLQSRFGDFG